MIILNIYVILKTRKYIFESNFHSLPKKEYVIVPGAGLTKNKKPSRVLSDRLDGAVMLFNSGLAEMIVISGDHKGEEYSETEAMKTYLEEKGIPSCKILRDDKGFSTFETVFGSRKKFNIKSAYFASQAFHLPRLVYIGRKLGIDACGFKCNFHKYSMIKHLKWRLREIPSRVKDVFLSTYCIICKKI